MKLSGTTPVLAAFLLLLLASPAVSQTAPDDVAVWAVIEAQWQATEKGDTKWVESLLAAADFTNRRPGSDKQRTS